MKEFLDELTQLMDKHTVRGAWITFLASPRIDPDNPCRVKMNHYSFCLQKLELMEGSEARATEGVGKMAEAFGEWLDKECGILDRCKGEVP